MKIVFSTIQKAFPYIAILLFLFFLYPDVVFFGKTLETSQSVAQVMPDGQYEYPGEKLRWPTARDPGASAWQYVPLFELSLDEYRHGKLPLWNEYSGLGSPLAAQMQSSAFFLPQVLIAALQGFDFNWDFYLLLRFFIAGLFTYLFCKKIGLSKFASLLASFLFMGNGYFLFYGNMSHINVEMLLPFFLWTIEGFRQSINQDRFATFRLWRLWWRFLLLALSAHFLITAGFPKATFFAFAFGGLYLLFRFARANRRSEHTAKFSHSLAAICLGILLSAFLLIPFFEYVKNAASIHTSDVSKSLSFYPLKAIVTLFLPEYYGSLPETWATKNPVMPFVSLLVWPLALFALFYKKYRSLVLFFAAIALFYLLKTFGLPLVEWMQNLPVLKLMYFPKYLFVEFAFSMALLAAIGFEKLRVILNQRQKISIFIMIIIGGLFFIESASHFWFQRHLRHDPFRKPPFVEFLQEKQKTEPSFRIFSTDNYLLPNTAAAFRLHDIRMNDALYPKGYYELMKQLLPEMYDRFTGSEIKDFALFFEYANFLNIRYVIAKLDSRSPVAKKPWPTVYAGNDAWIFENPLLNHDPKKLAPYAFNQKGHLTAFRVGSLVSILAFVLLMLYARLLKNRWPAA